MVEPTRIPITSLPGDYYRHLLQMESLIVQHLTLGSTT